MIISYHAIIKQAARLAKRARSTKTRGQYLNAIYYLHNMWMLIASYDHVKNKIFLKRLAALELALWGQLEAGLRSGKIRNI